VVSSRIALGISGIEEAPTPHDLPQRIELIQVNIAGRQL